MSSKTILLGSLGATLLAGLIAGPFSVKSASTRAYAFTKTQEFRPAAWLTGADRFPSGAQVYIATADGAKLLAPGFWATADAVVSFDAQRILFSGKQTSTSPWQIWEVSLSGGKPRRVTSGTTACVKPLYLPDDQIAFTRSAPVGSSIEVLPLAGGTPVQVTFAPGRYLTDDILYDGRILFEAQRAYQGAPVRELFTVFPDGSGVESLRCDHGGDRHSARQLSSRDVLFVQGGRLGRFTSALARQTGADQPGGQFGGAASEFAPGELLASLRTPSDRRLALYLWDGALRKLQGFENANAVDPVPITVRDVPRRFPSALVPSRGAANLLCLKANITRDAEIHGIFRKVRILALNSAGKSQVLGETPVQADGSFYVQLPGETALRMELVDDSGRVVRAEKNWFWMKTGEQRVCVGCHAGPERAPDNDVPQALLKSVVPVRMFPTEAQSRMTE